MRFSTAASHLDQCRPGPEGLTLAGRRSGLEGRPGGSRWRMVPRVSVLLPAYQQAAFLGRAVVSLLAQTVADWELVVVNDGSTDGTGAVLEPFRGDPRIRCLRLPANRGLGAALNAGLDASAAPLVAYLPADDRWDPWHLEALCRLADNGATLAWSGCRHHGDQVSLGPPEGFGLQLVQALHRRTADRWVDREQLESDDLERLYWAALRRRGRAAGTGVVSCEWVDHPDPLRFHSSDSGTVDEAALYRRFKERPDTPPAADGLKILLVGELAYNPERVLALEERGHRLYGLWTSDGLGASTVGPLPFGHVTDLPDGDWAGAVRRLRPDVIYALLNWRAVPFAHAVLSARLGVPFVWHFKESPFRCIANGTWPRLVDLVTGADAAVLSSPEELAWFDQALPGRLDPARTLALDGDLPKADWLGPDPAGRLRLSDQDGELHTVVLGRPLGLDPVVVATLARAGIHLHLHGQVRAPGPKGDWASWIDQARALAPGHVHLHPHIGQDRWGEVLPRYDAGWLHHLHSANGGDLGRATWDDLNYPARIPPLVAAGVPLLQRASPGCTVAAQELVGRLPSPSATSTPSTTTPTGWSACSARWPADERRRGRAGAGGAGPATGRPGHPPGPAGAAAGRARRPARLGAGPAGPAGRPAGCGGGAADLGGDGPGRGQDERLRRRAARLPRLVRHPRAAAPAEGAARVPRRGPAAPFRPGRPDVRRAGGRQPGD